MPTLSGCGNFMSFMGDGNFGWGDGRLYDKNLTYAGTWGVGLRLHDLSFVEDLKHSIRVAYWGGTNSPAMAKYVSTSYGWNNQNPEGPYLTTNDGLVEFNLVNSYQIYDNLEANLELGYIINLPRRFLQEAGRLEGPADPSLQVLVQPGKSPFLTD